MPISMVGPMTALNGIGDQFLNVKSTSQGRIMVQMADGSEMDLIEELGKKVSIAVAKDQEERVVELEATVGKMLQDWDAYEKRRCAEVDNWRETVEAMKIAVKTLSDRIIVLESVPMPGQPVPMSQGQWVTQYATNQQLGVAGQTWSKAL